MYDFCLMTPVYSGVDGITCHCVEEAHHQLPLWGINFKWYIGAEGHGDALIARARSVEATQFLENGYSDYMIFLDSDIVFRPIDLKQLSEDLHEGYDLIAGCYPCRSGTQLASHWWNDEPPVGELGIYEAQFISTGFMGISKKLLKRMVKKLKLPILHPNDVGRSYPFFEDHRGWIDKPDASGSQDIWISEDWDFCEKAREIGVKSYLDTRIQLRHQATKIVGMQDIADYHEKLQREREEDKDKYDVPLACSAPIILDIGAHVGTFSTWALKRWDKAKIYAYEPITNNFESLVENTKGLNVMPIKGAVRNNGSGTGIMYQGLNNCGEASFYNLGEQNLDLTETVEIITAKSLPKADIVKIDTEGCEVEILQGLDLSNTKAVMLEAHRKEDIEQIWEILKDFDLISTVNNLRGRWLMKFVKQSVTSTKVEAFEANKEKRSV